MAARRDRLLIGIALVCVTCSSEHGATVPCTPADFEYAESTLNRPVVEGAAARANAILGETDVYAWPTWAARRSSGRPMPIYIVDDAGLARTDLAFSPNGGNCLFINRRFLGRFVELFGQESMSTFDVAPEDALALVLLHELGHFHNGDAGVYAEPVPITAATLSDAIAAAETPEVRADKFAGQRLGEAAVATDERGTAAVPLIVALGNITWNLQKRRLLDHFGATGLGLSSVLGDPGYSHPNLELRFLIIAYVSSPPRLQPMALELLDAFLRSRGRGRAPSSTF